MPGAWGACMDVGGKYAGTLSGAMNMIGNIGGAVSPTAIGYILRWTNNNWDLTFYVSAAVYAHGRGVVVLPRSGHTSGGAAVVS